MFERHDRGADDWTVLVPGWGFEPDVLLAGPWPGNLALWRGEDPERFVEALGELPAGRTTVVGWSMGAYLAGRLVAQCPDRAARVVLVAARPAYPQGVLAVVRQAVRRHPEAFLRRFYRDCFWPDTGGLWLSWRDRLRGHIASLDPDRLLRQLDWMERQRLAAADFAAVESVTVVHGRQDRIAPWQEMDAWTRAVPRARRGVLDGVGHLPFLCPAVEQWL